MLTRHLVLAAALLQFGCGGSGSAPDAPPDPLPDPGVQNLYALAPPGMPVGVAVPAGGFANSLLASPARQTLVANHFSQLTAENIMKPSYLHPDEGTFFFGDADELVGFAHSQGKTVHGHVLVWHQQVPDWMTAFTGDAAAWENMMTGHISAVVQHFAADDIVTSWDVVNEAFADGDSDGDGLYDYRHTIWYDNIGAGYLAAAFRAARAADGNADLYYNDYNLAGVPAKLSAVLQLVDDFASDPDPVPIDGIGFQMHISLEWPAIGQVRESLARAAASGLKVKITELDITVNTEGNGDPGPLTMLTSDVALRQQQRYESIVAAYLDEVPPDQRGGISVWGIADVDSWRRSQNAYEWPLLFDDDFAPKPALQGFADGLSGH
ncbi:MAG: endo-1,4-beta-xylanase [Woeseiaceae bacterium]